MSLKIKQSDNIFSPITLIGRSAITVFRISGYDISSVVSSRNNVISLEPRKSTYIKINCSLFKDVVLVTYFPSPHSYTGEDVIEISIHGGRVNAELFINYINPLLVSIARKFSELEAKFTGFQIKPKSGYKRVSISYENDQVKKIVKYLRKYVNKVLEYPMSERYDPHVNLFTVKGNIAESNLSNEMIPEHFKINSIDILAGTPKDKRSGMPSKHDTMNMEIHRSIPLVG